MTINELAKKYGIDKRTVDYWTTSGYLHPEIMPNGYRDYTGQTEEELKRVLVIDAMGVNDKEKWLKVLEYLPKSEWEDVICSKIRKQIELRTKRYTDALKFVDELKKK